MSYSGEEVAGFSAASAAPVVRVVRLLLPRAYNAENCNLQISTVEVKRSHE